MKATGFHQNCCCNLPGSFVWWKGKKIWVRHGHLGGSKILPPYVLQKNHRRQCRRKFFSCDESRRLSSQKSGDIVLFQHAFWMSDFFDECCPPSSKNMWGAGRDVVMSCFFWWMLATFIKKNTLSVDRDVVIAHLFWWMQATFIKKSCDI